MWLKQFLSCDLEGKRALMSCLNCGSYFMQCGDEHSEIPIHTRLTYGCMGKIWPLQQQMPERRLVCVTSPPASLKGVLLQLNNTLHFSCVQILLLDYAAPCSFDSLPERPYVSSGGENKLLLVCRFLMASLHNSGHHSTVHAKEDSASRPEILSMCDHYHWHQMDVLKRNQKRVFLSIKKLTE